jgi:hypothetical protein
VEAELGFEDYVKARGARPFGELDALFYGTKYLAFMGGEKHLVFVTERGPSPTWEQVKYLTSTASNARVALDTIQVGDRILDGMSGLPLPTASSASPQAGGAAAGGESNPAATGDARPGMARPTEGGRAPDGTSGSVSPFAGVSAPSTGVGGIAGALPGIYDLRYVASQTGGLSFALKEAAPSLARIDTATRAHYLLAYYPSNADWNGRYRSIKVQVNRPGARVLFRHGYYASREVETFNRRRVVSASHIESAGYQVGDIREIDVQIAPAFTKSATGPGGELAVEISIDAACLSWGLDEETRHTAHLDVAIYCSDGGGEKIIGQTRRELNLALTDETYERVTRERFSHTMRVPVTATPRFVKVIVYDYEADKVGSIMRKMK